MIDARYRTRSELSRHEGEGEWAGLLRIRNSVPCLSSNVRACQYVDAMSNSDVLSSDKLSYRALDTFHLLKLKLCAAHGDPCPRAASKTGKAQPKRL